MIIIFFKLLFHWQKNLSIYISILRLFYRFRKIVSTIWRGEKNVSWSASGPLP